MTTSAELQADFANTVDDAMFGESITYTPTGGAATAVTGFVYRRRLRSRPQRNDGAAGSSVVEYAIEVAISKADIDTVTLAADTVALCANIGDSATKTYRVAAVIAQDPAVWHLGLAA
jgi:hypothetical protein